MTGYDYELAYAYDDELKSYEPKQRTWADERMEQLEAKGKENWNQEDWDAFHYILNAKEA